MKIFVGSQEAVLKKDFSFEYTSENRLFLGRDGYTLNIAFPLIDCPQNRLIFGQINRKDVVKSRITFECTIVDRETLLIGTLAVVKVSDTEIECQFAEGRCEQTVTDPFEDTLITDLDLGAPTSSVASSISPNQAWRTIDNGAEAVALPWINENYPTVPNNWVKYSDGAYSWESGVSLLSWQPYLIVIAKRICTILGYEPDFTEWEQSNFRYLIICNTIPGSWNQPQYANVLPGWTVSEFFEKLELFLMCEFDFDHKAKSVNMRFSKNKIAEIEPVKVDEIVDEYSVEISQEDNSNCDYLAAKRLAYKECSHSMWNYYSCDWYVANCKTLKKYDTLSALIEANKRKENIRDGQVSRVFWGEQMGEGYDLRFTTVNALLFAKDVNTYFVFRSIGTEIIGSNHFGNIYTQIYVLQPVNVFGSGQLESDDVDTEELEFVPPCIMDTYVSEDDDLGYMMWLSPSSYSGTSGDTDTDSSSGTRPGANVDYDASAIAQPSPASSITKGEKEKKSEYYDEIYVAFWNGYIPEHGKNPYPLIDGVIVTQDWKTIRPGNSFSMRLHNHLSGSSTSFASDLPQINAKQKFKFSWLGSSIPNPRAIFYIKGKRYLCEKITATFTENGMSQLLKGEFYPLLED